ncbi:hypothetical protein B0H14DRAFT_3472230 [Mycena olivaceomarginata]|nr:hypothetical protein B0H14DRAFT_3472230 [Mycena olivaceomarginata]
MFRSFAPTIPTWGRNEDPLTFYAAYEFEILGICYRAEVEHFLTIVYEHFDFVTDEIRAPDEEAKSVYDNVRRSMWYSSHPKPCASEHDDSRLHACSLCGGDHAALKRNLLMPDVPERTPVLSFPERSLEAQFLGHISLRHPGRCYTHICVRSCTPRPPPLQSRIPVIEEVDEVDNTSRFREKRRVEEARGNSVSNSRVSREPSVRAYQNVNAGPLDAVLRSRGAVVTQCARVA